MSLEFLKLAYFVWHVFKKYLLWPAYRVGAVVVDQLVEGLEGLSPDVVLAVAEEDLKVLDHLIEFNRGRKVLGWVLAVADQERAVDVLELAWELFFSQ